MTRKYSPRRREYLPPRDLDALKRAMEWGKGYQRREPQLRMFPGDVMPDEGTEEWIELALYFVSAAQSDSLHLRPWETPPLHTHDDGIVDSLGWGRRPNEVALLRKMIALGLSRFEPDPLQAIDEAERREDRDREVRTPYLSRQKQNPASVAFRAKRTPNLRRGS
jgi:hypothetical protein